MRWLLVPLILLAYSAVLLAAMSDSKAATEAFKIWGINAVTARHHPFGVTSETKQIGFLSPGCESAVTFVAQGSNTWDTAFANLPADKGILGTYSGMVTLHAEVDLKNMTQTPLLQFLIDNAPAGSSIPAIQGANEIEWDSRSVPDGFHVICSKLSVPDDTSLKALQTVSHASMFIVKQGP